MGVNCNVSLLIARGPQCVITTHVYIQGSSCVGVSGDRHYRKWLITVLIKHKKMCDWLKLVNIYYRRVYLFLPSVLISS